MDDFYRPFIIYVFFYAYLRTFKHVYAYIRNYVNNALIPEFIMLSLMYQGLRGDMIF